MPPGVPPPVLTTQTSRPPRRAAGLVHHAGGLADHGQVAGDGHRARQRRRHLGRQLGPADPRRPPARPRPPASSAMARPSPAVEPNTTARRPSKPRSMAADASGRGQSRPESAVRPESGGHRPGHPVGSVYRTPSGSQEDPTCPTSRRPATRASTSTCPCCGPATSTWWPRSTTCCSCRAPSRWPQGGGGIAHIGRLGGDMDVEAGQASARGAAEAILASVHQHLGSLDDGCCGWCGSPAYVTSDPGFKRSAQGHQRGQRPDDRGVRRRRPPRPLRHRRGRTAAGRFRRG